MFLSSTTVLLQLLASASPQAPEDGKAMRDARAAQVRFESVRRMHLPREWGGGGSGGRCDARIGRYCYWYDSTESRVVPEPAAIVAARSRLLSVLDSASRRSPGDAWLAGQRTRYLIEAGRVDDAVEAARACRSERWWCAALEGLALHVSERYDAADSVFAVALSAMPESQRCEWLDLATVVPETLEREFSSATCAERAHLAERLWALSQPLWSTRGNDLRTEHFARMTMASIFPRSANAHGMSWGDDSRELLVRYGWAEWFTRREAGPGLQTQPAVTGHDREPSFAFFPAVRSLRASPRIGALDWSLGEPTARSRYSPRHVKALSALPHQLVRFPRGDSMQIAVAFEVRDTGLLRDSLRVFLGAYQREMTLVVGTHKSVTARVANETLMASVEVRGEKTKRAARARYTVDALPRVAGWGGVLSDLLLFDPARVDSSTDVQTLMAGALTDMRVSARSPLGVHWEMEGTPSSDPVWFSLTVEPLRIGVARRVATRLRLAPGAAPVRLRWRSVIQGSPHAQSITLRLPSRARGRYRVVLSVQPTGQPALSSSREIEVVP